MTPFLTRKVVGGATRKKETEGLGKRLGGRVCVYARGVLSFERMQGVGWRPFDTALLLVLRERG